MNISTSPRITASNPGVGRERRSSRKTRKPFQRPNRAWQICQDKLKNLDSKCPNPYKSSHMCFISKWPTFLGFMYFLHSRLRTEIFFSVSKIVIFQCSFKRMVSKWPPNFLNCLFFYRFEIRALVPEIWYETRRKPQILDTERSEKRVALRCDG